ncbi:MAG: phospho-N-acetylmuramoyl-pentapeptide-transferase [Planctomycetota bacterium]
MLYEWLLPWVSDLPFLNVFRYITFRAAFAALTALLLSLFIGRRLIGVLRWAKIGERVEKSDSERLREMTQLKRETPTMGGILFLAAILIATVLWARLDNFYVLLALLGLVGFGVIGFLDDYVKFTAVKRPGLTARGKLKAQAAVALALVGALWYLHWPDGRTEQLALHVPVLHEWSIPLSWGLGLPFVALGVIVIVGSSNAVNLTDGLDGLAAGCVAIVSLTLIPICYLVGRADYSSYLNLTYVPGAGELAVFCSAVVGGLLGFLWFNCFPAQVFMGDTGSLPLGGALGLVAVSVHHELVLAIAGGIFVLEAISVILQVWFFKRRRIRLFRIAPIHHHFQFGGWHEVTVTIRFWIVGIILSLCSLALLKIR